MKPSMDENNSIVVFNSCYSKDAGENGASISDACGGRLRLGFSDVAHGWDASEAVETLLKAMNGNDTLDTDSPFRKAEFAVPYTEEYLESHKAAMYVENIIICDGNLNTTLCPAPIANTPFSTNFSTDCNEGFGCFLLDTRLDSSVASTPEISAVGGTIVKSYWIKLDGVVFGIGFHYKKTASEMQVSFDLEKNKNKERHGGRRAVPSRAVDSIPETTFKRSF